MHTLAMVLFFFREKIATESHECAVVVVANKGRTDGGC